MLAARHLSWNNVKTAMEGVSGQDINAFCVSAGFAYILEELTSLPIGKDASIIAFKGILKNILSKALENNILT